MSARAVTFWAVLAAYLALTLSVIIKSPVLTLDKAIVNLHLQASFPGYRRAIGDYVMLGQRGPATVTFLPFFLWSAWRQRSTRPIVMLLTALVVLNLSVGVVKYATGRMGPFHHAGVHDIFAGGDIYPSGHVSNAVVLYGLVAWLVPRFRKTAVTLAVVISVTVGLGTIYLRTHWFSDVVGGWLAGSLVLLTLPTVLPYTQRWCDAVTDWVDRRWTATREISTVSIPPPPQRKSTPVSSVASSHSFAATVSSREALDDPTSLGYPRSSAGPLGP
jgi:membrane-associated phospholipid phosphatase